ncbi:uncharacterized protein HMPREF1541_08347 [Cyphellophora europaea CBS 101466]|uniref:NACHT domain-containing protein n=1 Tax=Cyphellophora europaea (strain CBS 101466) TaxID=1220924 RepID=W2RLI9_CYPE1|nr:uncharacterized protein HMPREF1541_08347 [Cyphellophora europaea CBS 101466]ETN37356.1 hypothetical protein HMPREF1541_08347 [Cyphellophora europaea CBS 101466]
MNVTQANSLASSSSAHPNPPSSPPKGTQESAWQVAVAQYLSRLPVELRTAFKAPADADDCLTILQAAQARNRKFDRLVSILEPLIEPLKRFENSIDVLVQTWQTVASPIWGPIRAIVTIANGRLATLNTIVVLLERLVEPLKRFHNYETLFEQNVALRHAIGALYCDLLEFCTRLAVHHARSPLRQTFGSFDKDVTEISDKIRHHWAEVDVAANSANMVEAKEARQREERQRAEDLRRDVNRWLAPASVEDDLDRLSSTCADGSCQWVWDSPEMESLRRSDKPASLRINAFPGGGKSVASAQVVKMLQAREDTNVLYFFCRGTDADKSYATSVARTLAWQLLQIEQALYEPLAPIYNASGRQTADSEVLSFRLFDTVLKETQETEIYVVIDALDECYDASRLVTLLIAAQTSINAHLKLIFSSRNDPVITDLIDFCNNSLSLQRNTDPLHDYIADGIRKLELPLSSVERDEIQRTIRSSSEGGLWLFARLMLEELQKATSMDEVREQTQTVPDGLAQLYTSIFKQREKQLSKAHLRMSQQLFLWLRTADYIPPDQWRARGDHGLDDDVLHILFQYVSKTESEIFDLMSLIQRLAAPLVTTRLLHEGHIVLFINGKAVQSSAFVAETFHQTADQYLLWCAEASYASIPKCLQPRRLAVLHRGACAAWYFSESAHFKHTLHHLQERPRAAVDDCYLEMTCALWQVLSMTRLPRSLMAEELEDVEELSEAVTSFLAFDGCLGFVEANLILHYSGQSSLLVDNVLPPEGAKSTPTGSRSRSSHVSDLIKCSESFKLDLRTSLTSFPTTSAIALGNEQAALCEFAKGSRARKIYDLARRYRYLSLSPGACSANGFLLSSKAP